MKSIAKINYTKKFKRTLVVLTASFIFLSFSCIVFSAMDPEEIREIHERAPYHLIGIITEDKLEKELSASKDSPSQLRTMTIEISELNRAPTLEQIRTVQVMYTYIPPWIDRDGGKGMDIAVGDVIEIWLEEGELGLEPAVGGDSVKHIFLEEERPNHIPEPISSKVLHAGQSFLQNPHTMGNIVVLSGIVAFTVLLAFFGMRRWRHSNE